MRGSLERLLLLLVLLALCGCAKDEVTFYSPNEPPLLADRLALTGTVCTADPESAQYPLRVLLLVDRAAGPVFGDYDPGAKRLAVLSSFIQSSLATPWVSMAVLGYAGRAKKLAPLEGEFTRNPGELLNAMTQLAIPAACVGEDLCRDPVEAVRSAGSVIEGDLASLPAGERILTHYVVLMVNAGAAEPLATIGDCCQAGEVCADAGSGSSACQAQLLAGSVGDLRDSVVDGGGAGLTLHAIQLAAGGVGEGAVQQTLQAAAFAGGGSFVRLDHVSGFGPAQLDVLRERPGLRVKHLIVANLSARPTADGPRVDSDGDGLDDETELALGTFTTVSDTDADGTTDLVELLVGLNALEPDAPLACEDLDPAGDADLDGLTDCDEALLGTDPSLVDSDGDAMPDRLELTGLTDYVVADAHLDADGDGESNGDELRTHTDPRSSDLALHFDTGYRYDVVDRGIEASPVLPELEFLTGVELVDLGRGTTPGVGTLRWDPNGSALTWQDAGDGEPGSPIDVSAGGEFLVPSSSWAPLQGEDGRFVLAVVSPPDLPPTAIAEPARVLFRDRQCLDWTVRNVRLLDTEGGDGGYNEVLVFLAQAPEDRPDVPGPYRLAHIPVRFIPPNERDPDDPIIRVLDAEFID